MGTKVLLLFGLVVIVCLMAVQAAPPAVVLNEKDDYNNRFLEKQLYELENQGELLQGPRHTRFACDTLDLKLLWNTGCSLLCSLRGHHGGRCKEGSCDCS